MIANRNAIYFLNRELIVCKDTRKSHDMNWLRAKWPILMFYS